MTGSMPTGQNVMSLAARSLALARWALLGAVLFTTLAWLALTGLPRQETALAILAVAAVIFVGAVLAARKNVSLAATLLGSSAGLLLAVILLITLVRRD